MNKKIIFAFAFSMILLSLYMAVAGTVINFNYGEIFPGDYFDNLTEKNDASYIDLTTDSPYGNLTAYFPFDIEYENSENFIAFDLSNHTGNNSVGQGNAVVNNTDCIYGDCLQLDGAGDSVSLSAYNYTGPYNFTVSLWFKLEDNNPNYNNVLFSEKISNAFGGVENYLYFDDMGNLTGYYTHDNMDGLCDIYWFSNITSNDSNWHHVVWQRTNNSAGKLYVDGALTDLAVDDVGDGDCTYHTGHVSAYIGMYNDGASNPFNGKIDEVMIFSEALTQQQVLDIYNNQSSRFNKRAEIIKTLNFTAGYGSINVTYDVENIDGSNITLRFGYWDSDASYNLTDGSLDTIFGFNEDSWNVVSGEIKDATGKHNATSVGDANTTIGGYHARAGQFDGSGDYISAEETAGNFSTNTNFTFCAWVNPRNLSSTRYIVEKYDSGASRGWYIYHNASGSISAVILFESGKGTLSTITAPLVNNSWNHVCMVWNNTIGGVRTFLDGSEDTNPVSIGSPTLKDFATSDSLIIGCQDDTPGYYWNGFIDEIVLFNRTLSSKEIKDIYLRGIVNWTFGERNLTSSVEQFNISSKTTEILNELIFLPGNSSTAFFTPYLLNFSIDVYDSYYPVIILDNPAEDFNTSESAFNFSFSVSDNYDGDINCSLYVDGNYIESNWTINNNSLTNLSVSGLGSGSHSWNISCVDIANNENWSATRNFYIDLDSPNYYNLSFNPNYSDYVDPDSNLTFNVTIIDSRVNISTAILQYYNGTDWSNKTMVYKGGDVYQTNITLVHEEVNYTYSIWMNDTFNNINLTENYTFASEWDCTWNITPSAFGQSSGWNQNKEIYNLTINNTGDVLYSNSNCTISFHLTHNLPVGRVYFNDSGNNKWRNYFDLDISATTAQALKINTTFGSESVSQETLTINVSDLGSVSEMASRISSGTLISSPGGSYLYQEIDSYPSSIDLTIGNYSFLAHLINVPADDTAENTAYNASFNWSFPSGFLILQGNENISYGNISDSLPKYQSLNITFNSTNLVSMSPGAKSVYIYSQGYNLSGELIEHADSAILLVEQINISVDCYNVSDNICVDDCGYTLDPDCSAPSTAASSSGGGGGGGSSSGGDYEKTEGSFELVRGEKQSFDLEIKNKYSKILKDLEISVSGINAEYISISPKIISKIKPKESKTISVKITAPAYFNQESYILTFRIEGISVLNKSKTKYTEEKKITLYILEVSREDATVFLEESKNMVNEMNSSGMVLKKVLELLEQVKGEYDGINFLEVKLNYEELQQIYDSAFESKEILKDLWEKVETAEKNGISVIETKKVLYMSETAFNRGDYILSLERLKEAKLTYALEVKGEFNILYTVKNNPGKTAGTIILLALFSFGSSVLIRLRLYKKKLRMLEEEEKLLLELMGVVQRETFENNRMSMEEYEEAMSQYEKKLAKTIESKIKTQSKIANILKVRGKRKALFQERAKLIELLRNVQDDYLNKGKVETRVYENMLKTYSTRLSEIEEEIAFAEAQSALKKRKLSSKKINKIKLKDEE